MSYKAYTYNKTRIYPYSMRVVRRENIPQFKKILRELPENTQIKNITITISQAEILNSKSIISGKVLISYWHRHKGAVKKWKDVKFYLFSYTRKWQNLAAEDSEENYTTILTVIKTPYNTIASMRNGFNNCQQNIVVYDYNNNTLHTRRNNSQAYELIEILGGDIKNLPLFIGSSTCEKNQRLVGKMLRI